jgi:phosphate butyryltransferase
MKHGFDQILQKIKNCPRKKIAVAAAQDDAVLKALAAANKQNIVDAVLVGDQNKIERIAGELNIDLTPFEIINEPDPIKSSLIAVKLAHDGETDMYMKGLIDTKNFLRSVLDKEVGLRTDKKLSHVCVFEIPGIERLLFLTDVAFITYPTLNDRISIIENTLPVAHACGVKLPKVAPLAALEVVNPKMPVTQMAAELTKLNEDGKITGCIIDGPLSFDLAISPNSVRHKEVSGRKVLGDADILLVPDVHAGNILYKAIVHLMKVKNGNIMTGTKVPVVVTSRSDSFETKMNSIILASVVSEEMKQADS